MGILMACPHLDLAPLMAWMEERRRENARRQRSQHRVWLYIGMVPLGGKHGVESLVKGVSLPGQASSCREH